MAASNKASAAKERGMTAQMEAFATGLACGLTQAEAYRKAYPKSTKWKDEAVWVAASKLAAHANVRIRVQELLQKAASANEVTVERVIAEMARIAFFDIRRLVNADGTPKALHDLDDGTAAAIAGLEVARVGNAVVGEGEVLKFKIADKNSALEKLARHLGMFVDRREISGPGGGPITTQQLQEMSDADLERIAAGRSA